jgi:hypothetical protein
MEIKIRDRNHVREILRASEGIPTQIHLARIESGRVSPAPIGHALANHLHSVSLVDGKTKFLSLDDMVEALWLLLQAPAATAKLGALKVGFRDTIEGDVPRLFAIQCEVRDPQGRPTIQRVKFTPEEQRLVGRSSTSCVAVVEGRERAGTSHLQIHSFFPRLTATGIQSLIHHLRNHPPR